MTKTYTEEFKQDAVQLVGTSGKAKTQVARDLEISESALYRWLKEYGHAREQSIASSGQSAKDLEAELKRLRRENEVLRQERDILKKAISICSQKRQGSSNWAISTAASFALLLAGHHDIYAHITAQRGISMQDLLQLLIALAIPGSLFVFIWIAWRAFTLDSRDYKYGRQYRQGDDDEFWEAIIYHEFIEDEEDW